MYTLYGKKGSGSASTEAALTIIGAPYRIVETASWATNAAFDDLLKINPLGQIPTLVLPDGSVLSESAAILIHLGDAHPERTAAGRTPRRARRRSAGSSSSRPIAMPRSASSISRALRARMRDEATQERIRAGTRERLHQYWEMFADLFPARPWLGGETLGALDLYAAVVSKWSGSRAHLAEGAAGFPRRCCMRIEADPRVAAVFAQHWPRQVMAATFRGDSHGRASPFPRVITASRRISSSTMPRARSSSTRRPSAPSKCCACPARRQRSATPRSRSAIRIVMLADENPGWHPQPADAGRLADLAHGLRPGCRRAGRARRSPPAASSSVRSPTSSTAIAPAASTIRSAITGISPPTSKTSRPMSSRSARRRR